MKQNNTNVIFIGSFSPVHDGHIHLIEEYLKNGNNIDIIISGSPREGISPESSYNFLTKIFKNPRLGKKRTDENNPNVNIEISKDNSPMLTAINKVKNAKSGTFALASSTKQGDETRSLDFKKKFEKGKSLYNPKVNVIKLNVNAEPLYYYNRTDQYNDKPISSTVIRHDIRNNDFDNFIKSYENIMKNYKISGNDIKEYYDIVRNELLPIKESALYDDMNESTEFKRPENIISDNIGYYKNLYKAAELTKNKIILDKSDFDNQITNIIDKYSFYSIDNISKNLIKANEKYLNDINKNSNINFESYPLVPPYIDENRKVLMFIFVSEIIKNNKYYMYIFIDTKTLKPLVDYDFTKLSYLNESNLTNFKRPENIVKDNGYYSKLFNLINKTKNAFISFDNSKFSSINDLITNVLNYYNFESIKYLRYDKRTIDLEYYKKLINLYNEYYNIINDTTYYKLKYINDVSPFILIDDKSNIILFYYSFVKKRYSANFKREIPDHTWLHIFLDAKTLKPIDGFNINDLYIMDEPNESLNEDDGFDFKKQSNIIDDTIGINNLISNWIKEHTNIKQNEYVINDDHTIDVTLINDPNNQKLNKRDTVYIFGNEYDFINKISELPEYIKFNIINNNLNVSNSEFKTLKGFPITIIGNFDCSNCQLETLEYGPKYVTGKYICSYNVLKNIDGAPIKCEEFIGIPQYLKPNGTEFSDNKFTHDYWFKNYYNKTNESINEGGAAKHMSHPYEINEFTFKDIEKLINDLLNGNINNATEKMDGLNLFVSFDKNGNIIAARNNKHLNGEPLTLENIKDNFKSSNIGNVYYNALKSIFNEVKSKYNNQSLKYLFKNGNRWLNTEIITADTENVIPYENSTIVFHDFRTYDNGELIKTDKDKLEEFVKSLSNNSEFKIITSPHIKINKSIDKKFKDEIINDINKIKSKYNLSDSSTIEDYKKNVLLDIILNDKILSELSDNVVTDLIDRWLNGPNKNYNINDILRGLDDSTKSYVKQIDKNINGFINDKMKPFDIIFIKVGNEVINNLSNISNNQNKDIVIQKLNKRLSDVAEQIANSDDENNKTKLYKELERLSNVSNKLNATEGIVFNWKDKLLKITGSFAPLNKILGLAPGRFDN